MTTINARCRHSATYPMSGMRKVGFAVSGDVVLAVPADAPDLVSHNADLVAFACDRCGQTGYAQRCASVAERTGERCRAAAVTGQPTCSKHRTAAVAVFA